MKKYFEKCSLNLLIKEMYFVNYLEIYIFYFNFQNMRTEFQFQTGKSNIYMP